MRIYIERERDRERDVTSYDKLIGNNTNRYSYAHTLYTHTYDMHMHVSVRVRRVPGMIQT